MKKIVFLVRNMTVGGIQRLVADDANECYRRGIETWIVYLESDRPGDSLMPTLHLPRENIIYIPYPRMRNLRGFLVLFRLLRRVRPDVLVTHQWFANTIGRIAAFVARVPVVSFEHSTDGSRKPGKQIFVDRILQVACKRIVAVSDAVKDSLVSQGIRKSRITVVHNGINLAPYRLIAAHRVSTGNEVVRFIFIGRLIEEKGVDVLLKAFGRIRSRATLSIAGTGPEEKSLQNLVRELNLGNRVSFLGVRTDIPELLVQSDCLVLPSRREGFGLVVVEAHAAGVPTIVSDLPGIRAAIAGNEGSAVVPAGDMDALSEAMNLFATDSALRAKLASRASDHVENFSIGLHVDTLLSVLSS